MPYTLMDAQQGCAGGGTTGCGCEVVLRAVRSSRMLDAHGMVRDVFMEIRQD
jgi:hypothetical protein